MEAENKNIDLCVSSPAVYSMFFFPLNLVQVQCQVFFKFKEELPICNFMILPIQLNKSLILFAIQPQLLKNNQVF